MKNLSEVSIHNRVLVWYFIILIAIAGIFSYMKLGRMEDPTYTVRTMVVSVAWPGATAERTRLKRNCKIRRTWITSKVIPGPVSRSSTSTSTIRRRATASAAPGMKSGT